MNNPDLLIVAKGMGFDAILRTNVKLNSIEKYIQIHSSGSVYKFSPTEGELINWLLETDEYYINFMSKYFIELVSIDEKRNFTNESSDIKENLLNIVLQVVKNSN